MNCRYLGHRDQAGADARLPLLVQVPAVLHFASVEPLLSRVSFRDHDWTIKDYLRGVETLQDSEKPLPGKIGWCIVGTESGPGARWVDNDLVRAVVDECIDAGVPVFVKQIANDVDRKGGNPEHWPPGVWPRQFPQLGAAR